jgi:hypothetical protein
MPTFVQGGYLQQLTAVLEWDLALNLSQRASQRGLQAKITLDR